MLRDLVARPAQGLQQEWLDPVAVVGIDEAQCVAACANVCVRVCVRMCGRMGVWACKRGSGTGWRTHVSRWVGVTMVGVMMSGV